MKVVLTGGGPQRFTINCTNCGGERPAEKVRTKVGRTWMWANRCASCGAEWGGLPPHAGVVRLARRALERAGQLRLRLAL